MKVWLAFAVLVSGPALAAPDTSARPPERPSLAVQEGIAVRSAPVATLASTINNGSGVNRSLRPKVRPRKFRKIARAQERLRQKGAVCGDINIQGDVAGRVNGERTGCGIQNAVRVRAVSGITLSQPALLDCKTAQALKSWVDVAAKPALSDKGGGLKQLRVASHYSCRTRNSRAGARLSEHSKGRAIDISAFRLKDGSLITVQNGWNSRGTAKAMRQMHKGACGPFGTVLGPESDRFHVDHFHFDTARYRSGPYCR